MTKLQLSGAVPKAFTHSKAAALELLGDTAATKVTLPFVEEQLKAARGTMGGDPWSCGVAAARLVPVEELFHLATCETYST